ncbi:universal stress protein [Fontivita pretiosa]|uniref:universal stress protein n=1 Tax=Fontivita pretiosa TaxID=2989684 RepID=UPI003D173045
MVKKILLAYDGSEPAGRAFDKAMELAAAFRAEVVVLAVAQPPEPATMVETSAILEAATEHFQKDFARLRRIAESHNVPLETRLAVGHAAEQIVHVASEIHADLIVMGHRGKSLLQRWLLGSVSKRVLSYAPCSVLIVR